MTRAYVWTAERISVLREMALEGRSQSQMAVVFGVSEVLIRRTLQKFNIQTPRKIAFAKVKMFEPELPQNLERWAKAMPW